MTLQEAIEIITNAIQIGNVTVEQDKASAMAQKALAKQIPKKPIDVCTPVITWGVCPVCKGEKNKLGSRANRVFESNAFCPQSGQKLDWSDEE